MYSSPLAASSAIWTLKIHESDEHPGRKKSTMVNPVEVA
jgi:hypothetical protein